MSIKKKNPVHFEPIDFVYTWVDGAKNAALKQQGIPSDRRGWFNRFRNNQELIQSIKSVRCFAPFVRKIFIITADGQIPDWYVPSDYPEIRFIHHFDIFKEHAALLPVFNSHSIEAMIPHIPGLAEQFVYFNDDMFLGAEVQPTDFFTPDGVAILRFSEMVGPGWQAHSKAWRVYRGNLYAVLQELYPNMEVYETAHQAKALLKTSCLNSWNNNMLKKLLIATATNKFRSLSDIPPIELFSNIMIQEKRATVVQDPGLVLHIFDRTVLKPEFLALKMVRPTFYCINDEMIDPSHNHLERLRYYLKNQLPHHSSFTSIGYGWLGGPSKFIAHCISWCNRMLGGALKGQHRQNKV